MPTQATLDAINAANEGGKRFLPLVVIVRVFDVKADKEIRSRTFDFNNLELRSWFERLQIWALKQGHAVELVKADAENG